jgi:hypothetical protein
MVSGVTPCLRPHACLTDDVLMSNSSKGSNTPPIHPMMCRIIDPGVRQFHHDRIIAFLGHVQLRSGLPDAKSWVR